MSSISSILHQPGAPVVAPLNNPTLTGTVNVPTQADGDSSTKIASTAFVRNAIKSVEYYYGDATVYQTVATKGGNGTDLIFDASGNLYWAMVNRYDGTTYSQTSYLYKITPAGVVSTFASKATVGAIDTALAFDTSGNLFWSIACAYTNTTNYTSTSYVLKITPAGTLTTFASQTGIAQKGCDLVFDSSDNLYWALTEGSAYGTPAVGNASHIFKITSAGVKTTFATTPTATAGTYGTGLVIDTNGTLYWANATWYNGTTGALTSYLYKVTAAGVLSTLATQSTNLAIDTDLTFDASGNLYWGIAQTGTSSLASAIIYTVNKSDGTLTTFFAQSANAGRGIKLLFADNQDLLVAFSSVSNLQLFRSSNSSGAVTNISSVTALTPGYVTLVSDFSHNIFISTPNFVDGGGTIYNLTSYLYRIDKQTN